MKLDHAHVTACGVDTGQTQDGFLETIEQNRYGINRDRSHSKVAYTVFQLLILYLYSAQSRINSLIPV